MDTWDNILAYKSRYYFHTWIYSSYPHAMNIVGYGYDENYKRDYRIITNSLDSEWGEGKDNLGLFLASIV
jgi:hypothetical protein